MAVPLRLLDASPVRRPPTAGLSVPGCGVGIPREPDVRGAPTAPSGVGGVPAVGTGEELVSPMSGAHGHEHE